MKYTDITTVRLPQELDQKLETYSSLWNTTKTEIIKEALQNYFANKESEKDSWEVGESFFGNYGNGVSDMSQTYKKRIKEKLRLKAHHTRPADLVASVQAAGHTGRKTSRKG